MFPDAFLTLFRLRGRDGGGGAHCARADFNELSHYGFAPHETRRSKMQISCQKNIPGMRNKVQNCQSFKSRLYINVITIVSALSV